MNMDQRGHTPEELARIAVKAREDGRPWEEVLARARCKARGIEYNPDADHGQARPLDYVSPETDARMREIISHWQARRRDRPDVRKVAGL